MRGDSYGDPQDAGGDQLDQLDQFELFTGDRAAAMRLRANLDRIAEEHPGTAVESIAREVLAGRRSIRDLADDPEFSKVITEGVDDYRRYLDTLTPTERAQMVDDAKSGRHPG